jgi:hypothetical protein
MLVPNLASPPSPSMISTLPPLSMNCPMPSPEQEQASPYGGKRSHSHALMVNGQAHATLFNAHITGKHNWHEGFSLGRA